jgi:adenosylhomocysteinase
MVNNHKKMEGKVYAVPDHIDEAIARIKLRSMGIEIDSLTKEQTEYISGWEEGT